MFEMQSNLGSAFPKDSYAKLPDVANQPTSYVAMKGSFKEDLPKNPKHLESIAQIQKNNLMQDKIKTQYSFYLFAIELILVYNFVSGAFLLMLYLIVDSKTTSVNLDWRLKGVVYALLAKKLIDLVVFSFGYTGIRKLNLRMNMTFCYFLPCLIMTNALGVLMCYEYLAAFRLNYEIYLITLETIIKVYVLVKCINISQQLKNSHKSKHH